MALPAAGKQGEPKQMTAKGEALSLALHGTDPFDGKDLSLNAFIQAAERDLTYRKINARRRVANADLPKAARDPMLPYSFRPKEVVDKAESVADLLERAAKAVACSDAVAKTAGELLLYDEAKLFAAAALVRARFPEAPDGARSETDEGSE